MPQTPLERALRRTLADRVAVPRPLAADPAGVVLRRARAVQRRRAVAGVALAAVATVLVSTGVAQLHREPGRNTPPVVVVGDPDRPVWPAPTASTARPVGPDTVPAVAEVDLVVGAVIATAQGRRVTLTGVGPVERAQRLPDGAGWLAVGPRTAAGRFLWRIAPGGAAEVLLAGADEIVVDRAGHRVAWRQGAELVTAAVLRGQLTDSVRTAVPATADPVLVVGEAVLVRLDRGRSGLALWRPDAGAPRPAVDRSAVAVVGALPDGRVVAQQAGARPCLALLDPARSLAATRIGCVAGLGTAGRGAVSPDGRWALVDGTSNGQAAALLVDLDDPASARTALPPVAGTAAWTSDDAVFYPDPDGRLVRVEPLAGATARTTPVAGLPSGTRPVVVTGS
ncbi:hypothetical protein [Micromonospora nigra]|uniref:hypothetical protein n=1 Tax=Micromonospora nigra TaxID=145857 RepID=UPI001112E458|nr:hypothetical protein [Micromonospora nigra]